MPKISTYTVTLPAPGDIVLGNHSGVTVTFPMTTSPTAQAIVIADVNGRINPKSVSTPVGGDLYPNADSQGLFERAVYGNLFSPPATDDFDGSSLSGMWSWAAAPFVTPSGVIVANSLLQVSHSAVPNRYFAVLNVAPPASNNARYLRGVPAFSGADSYVGWRYDDGTDNNYVETNLREHTASSWDIVTKYRSGGGAVTTTVLITIGPLPQFYTLLFFAYGTFWTSWNVQVQLYINSPRGFALTAVSGLTWTATRQGLIFDEESANQPSYVDWVK